MNSVQTNQFHPIASAPAPKGKPRLGFLGVGWIGRHRMEAIAASGVAEIAAIADTAPELANAARSAASGAEVCACLEELLKRKLDGIVIATPSALHADQAIATLEAGCAVFCQKPLGRNATEVEAVIRAARKADRLLGLDLSYRYVDGLRKIRELIRSGALGNIYAVDLEFHNAYGPDKAWFYDRQLSGGGCVIDLGIHLVDLALWALGFPEVERVSSRLFRRGEPWQRDGREVEDYAIARLDLDSGATVEVACSWKLHVGSDAEIRGSYYGTEGGAGFRNINGSFYDFRAEQWTGTTRTRLADPPDAWGGRAIVDWANRLSEGSGYDVEAEHWLTVAEVLDAIYRGGESVRRMDSRTECMEGQAGVLAAQDGRAITSSRT